MRIRCVLAALFVVLGMTPSADAQRRSGGLATLAISVTDPAGAPLTSVKVTVDGPASRQTRTERGRIAIEELPTGTYRLRFELEGFVTFEREVAARAGAPIDVKVTLTPAPKPPPPPEPVKPAPPPLLNVSPAAIDVPTFLEKNFVGRAVGKVSPLTCASGGSAVLLQMREPLEEHAHDDSDEFVYVIGGEGTARIAGTDHRLQAGMLLMVPRTVRHSFTARGRNPLVVISIKAGLPCP
jgi:mannose-6-phosphate isomerase-like protein (cupin superfamily)